MTQRTQGVLGVLIIATGLITALWLFSFEHTAPERPVRPYPEEASAVGTEENPEARLEYERRRLRNPETGAIPAGIRQRELAFAEMLPERAAKANSWQQRGPVNVGGRTRALAVDVSNENTILAGGVSGGIWRSADGGTTWSKRTGPSQLHSVTWLEQDTRSGETSTWYAGTGEYRGNSASDGGAPYRGDGIFKSTDGGQTWSLLSNTSTDDPDFDSMFDYIWKVAIDSSNASQDEVYAATYGGIQRSIDGGTSWSKVIGHGLFGATSRYTDVVVTSAGVVFAALDKNGDTADSEEGVFRSTDGTSWTEITPSGWPSSFDRTVLALTPRGDLWALVRGNGSGPNGHELWFYDDTAGSWTDFTGYLPARGVRTGDFNSQTNYDQIVAVHPNDGSQIFVGGRNLWRIDTTASASDANTWIGGYSHDSNKAKFAPYHPSGDEHHPDQHSIAFLPSNGDVMYVGSDGGVHRTDNNLAGSSGSAGDGAVTWTSLNDGYFTTQFYTVCFNPDDSDPVIAGGMQDNGTWSTTSSNPDVNWSEEWSGDGSYCAIQNKSGGGGTYRYVSSQNGNTYRLDYDTNGNSQGWTQINPSAASNQLFINPFVLDPTSPKVMFYPAGATMWRTADAETVSQSTGWTELTGIGSATSSSVTALDVSKASSAHVLYYGTSSGKVFQVAGADTAQASTSPTDITGASFNGYVSSIDVDPTDSDKVMVVFSNYGVTSIFYTSDGGSNWTAVEGNLGGTNGPSVRWAAILPQSGLSQTTYYVGTSVGLYSTTTLNDGSTVWSQEGASTIGNVVVEQVRTRQSDGLVLVGTHANGVYSLDAPLPVELTTFDAVADGTGALLTWQTASESDNAGFEVQQKAKGDDQWATLTFIEGTGTTSESQQYRYRASGLVPGHYRFRLKQVDVDGTFEYSSTVEVAVPLSGAYELSRAYPNPFRDQAQLKLTVEQPQHVEAVLYDALGRRVAVLYEGSVEAHAPHAFVVNNRNLSSGMYVIRVEGETFTATRKLTRVR